MIVASGAPGDPPNGGSAWQYERADDEVGRGKIELSDVSVGYGDETVLEDLSLQVERGDFLCVEGPSGAGKTTLLRLLEGSRTPDSGEVKVGQTVVWRDASALSRKSSAFSR